MPRRMSVVCRCKCTDELAAEVVMTATRLVPIAWRIGTPKWRARIGVSRTPPPMPVNAPSNPATNPRMSSSTVTIATAPQSPFFRSRYYSGKLCVAEKQGRRENPSDTTRTPPGATQRHPHARARDNWNVPSDQIQRGGIRSVAPRSADKRILRGDRNAQSEDDLSTDG